MLINFKNIEMRYTGVQKTVWEQHIFFYVKNWRKKTFSNYDQL